MQNMESLKNTALFKMMYGRVNAVKNAPAVAVKIYMLTLPIKWHLPSTRTCSF